MDYETWKRRPFEDIIEELESHDPDASVADLLAYYREAQDFYDLYVGAKRAGFLQDIRPGEREA